MFVQGHDPNVMTVTSSKMSSPFIFIFGETEEKSSNGMINSLLQGNLTLQGNLNSDICQGNNNKYEIIFLWFLKKSWN